jgi:molybdopterin synthase sulfur carrier subunit
MTIHVKYFASLRERLQRDEDLIEATAAMTTAEVWASLNRGMPMPDKILIAVNAEYASLDKLVKDGDEVAFFPPVTGG